MEIVVSKNGSKEGPYTLAEIRTRIDNGLLLPSDWGWHPELSDWVRLRTLFEDEAVVGAPQVRATPSAFTPGHAHTSTAKTGRQGSPHVHKPRRNWKAEIVACSTLLGCVLSGYGLWRSCDAQHSWSPGDPGSYERYKATEEKMTPIILVGFMLILPGLIASFAETKSKINRQLREKDEFDRKVRQNPDRCPNCGSEEFDTFYPSKPLVFTPLSFSGILLGGIANSMADAIIKPERVCLRCGCRWPSPE